MFCLEGFFAYKAFLVLATLCVRHRHGHAAVISDELLVHDAVALIVVLMC